MIDHQASVGDDDDDHVIPISGHTKKQAILDDDDNSLGDTLESELRVITLGNISVSLNWALLLVHIDILKLVLLGVSASG